MKILVCVAWPYASGPRHLGHAVSTFIPADVIARYHRMKGDEVLMVGGSDMHGTPTMVRADEEGVSPSVIAERYHALHAKKDRKSTRLNSSHRCISYAVFCLKKKKKTS